ncbi:hypothetical protein CCAX7_45210 [Capsulimonas corticalis]|uniref:Uncharacterized protein n=2 Tax=Capsulimonas corticalis TaxID=2219043 RepID=A0A402D6G9_9BACT|nr:hypothetical protein CCAX7_45210 [Capsulimonas corticalis]
MLFGVVAIFALLFACFNAPWVINFVAALGASALHIGIPRRLIAALGDLFLFVSIETLLIWKEIEIVLTDDRFRYRERSLIFRKSPWIEAPWTNVQQLDITPEQILLAVNGRKVQLTNRLTQFGRIGDAVRTKACDFSVSPALIAKHPILSQLNGADTLAIYLHLAAGRKVEAVRDLNTKLSLDLSEARMLMESIDRPFTRPLYLAPTASHAAKSVNATGKIE